MQTSGRLLLCGLCLFLSCYTVRGLRYLPPEAAHFPKCDPSQNECPANSSCLETNKGYYCACNHKFLNVKGKITITYPGGECLEFCGARENSSPCACRRGSALTSNANGLYQCRDTCRSDLDCPSEATCTAGNCYCKVCRPQGKSCITLVRLDEVCPAPVTTTTPLLTTLMRFPPTQAKPSTVAPQPGQTLTLPREAINFPHCDPAVNECPANSICLQTNKGYYCACDRSFLNHVENIPITYPGGECLEFCSAKENNSPCACRRGFVLRVNQNARYVCIEAPNTTTSPLLTTPAQTETGAPRTGEIIFLPPEAINFPWCDPDQNQCPANSFCLQTMQGYYCICDRNFLNVMENIPITYPGGECLEVCSAKENISPCVCRRGFVLRLNQNARYVCIAAPNTTASPLLTTPAQPGTRAPRPGEILILPPRAIHFPQCDPSLNQCPANSCCKNTNKGFHCACHTNFYNVKDELTFTYPGGECVEFCNVEGKTFPCACKPGFVAMLNENGLYVCIVNTQCQTDFRT